MCRQHVALLAGARERVGPWVVPHVAAIAPEPPELDIVSMRSAAVFVHEHQLILAAIQRAHPGVVLDPDTNVLELAIDFLASAQQFSHVPPIHTYEMQRALDAVSG